MDAHARPAVRTRTQARQVLPPIQIASTGEPVSVTDEVARAIVLAVALTAIAWVIGRSPTRIFSDD